MRGGSLDPRTLTVGARARFLESCNPHVFIAYEGLGRCTVGLLDVVLIELTDIQVTFTLLIIFLSHLFLLSSFALHRVTRDFPFFA